MSAVIFLWIIKVFFIYHKQLFLIKKKITLTAAGNVINIVNSRDVHWGNEIVYYMGPTNVQQKHYKEAENIEKSNIIILVMEAEIKVSKICRLSQFVKNNGKFSRL